MHASWSNERLKMVYWRDVILESRSAKSVTLQKNRYLMAITITAAIGGTSFSTRTLAVTRGLQTDFEKLMVNPRTEGRIQ